jgi:hypothetical protein
MGRTRVAGGQHEADAQERDILSQLRTMARGINPANGNRLSTAEQMVAMDRYNHLSAQAADREVMKERHAAEMALAADKIEVMKAEVTVKALEVLVKAGVPADQLLALVKDFSGNLLSAPTHLMLEAKEK